MGVSRWSLKPVRLAVIILSCVLLSACGTLSVMEVDAPQTAPTPNTKIHDLKAEVDALAKPLVESYETPGIVVGVLLPDGRQRFFGYGTIERGQEVTPDADTVFHVGSLSKGFLGALTAVMVQEGALSWDDTLGKFVPPDAPLSADARNITLLQLATHTSGLPRQPYTFQTLRYFLQYLFTGDNFYRHFDQDYVFKYLADFKAPKKAEPQYSNIGYGLLGYVLEQRSGQKLDMLMKQKLLEPLGLKNTTYLPEALPGNVHVAHGYVGDQPKFLLRGQPIPDWKFSELLKGSAGMYSSARELLLFAAAHMTDKQTPLNAGLHDTLQVRFPRAKDAPAVAWVVDDVYSQRITYQVGLVAGFTSYLGLDVTHRTAVVVLQNSFNWKGKVGHKLLSRLARGVPEQ
jgi:CubicO group peptidase (beta-lactamase class C family)